VETHMIVRLVLGLLITVVALAIAGRRVFFLYRMIAAGQPAPARLDDWPKRLLGQVTEVFGQSRLLKWNLPGLAHFFVFWGFLVLFLTIIEAYGAIFDVDFHIPIIGRSPVLGFLEDFFGVGVLLGLIAFAIIRRNNDPAKRSRDSRFYGSHTTAAWVVLGLIFLVILTLFGIRAAQLNTGVSPWQDTPRAPFFSYLLSLPLEPLGETVNERIEDVMVLGQIAVVMGFLVLVTYSKHLHIFLAPLNVLTKRDPEGVALGPLLPMMSNGKVLDFEEADPDTDLFGVGKVEDFKWSAMLDMATCTECGRCQSQCPAWNTGKPLSPKLLIMDLRDHLFAKAPYLLGTRTAPEDHVPDFKDVGEQGHDVPEAGYPRVKGTNDDQAVRPLVGTAEEGGVIDPDVLWSCTTCGACVEQCPVDIEHVDHILDMRRYQVLIESAFPSEAGVMLRNLEKNGNPWGLKESMRDEWYTDLPFEVRVVEDTIPEDVEYLFWVGCAGAFEDRAKKVTRAFAELLHTAGVEFAILGSAETCNGDPARRLGNEFVFQGLGMQNVETLNSVGAGKEHDVKIVATCPHCFNTLANEYPQLGGHYDVVHHTQLLGKLVEDGHLVPVTPVDEKVTYHDPCYLGRHNRVYTPPREILNAIPGFQTVEMQRCKERGFCCGAGGARMWMEEKIGKRVNVERTDEALTTDADLISTACPFCIVMLSDAVTAKQQEGSAKEGVQVLDVSQILARSLVAKEPAMAGAPAVEASDAVEAPKPVAATPDATAGADQAQLAQSAGVTGEGTVKDPASSGVTVEGGTPVEGAPADRTAPGQGPDETGGPAHNQTRPTGPTEGQGPNTPHPPAPKDT
jgi:Fe-S oxidoreductase